MEISGEFQKSIIGGFDRKQVLDYISKLDEDAKIANDKIKDELDEVSSKYYKIKDEQQFYDTKIKDLDEKILQLNAQIEELSSNNNIFTEQLAEKDKNIEQLKKDLEESQSLCDANSKELQLTKNKLLTTTDILELKNSQLEKTQQKLDECSSNLQDNNNVDLFKEKSKKYDAFASQLGKFFSDAHKRADLIIDNAVNESEKIAKVANESAVVSHNKFYEINEHISKLKGDVDLALKQMNSQLTGLSNEIDITLKKLAEGVTTTYKFETEQSEIDDLINTIALESQTENIKSISDM